MVMPAYNAGKTPLQDDHKIYTYAFILGFARLGLIYRYRLLRRGFLVTG